MIYGLFFVSCDQNVCLSCEKTTEITGTINQMEENFTRKGNRNSAVVQ